MINRTIILALAVALLWPLAASAADQPTRGMNKAEVRARFGAPEQIKAPVGQPPISRWRYPDFTVYFENEIALHSVREQPKRASAASQPERGELLLDQTPPANRQPSPAPEHQDNQPGDKPATAAPSEPDSESTLPPAELTPRAGLDEEQREQAGNFRFDPVTGRIVITDESAPSPSRPDDESAAPVRDPEQDGQPPLTHPDDHRH